MTGIVIFAGTLYGMAPRWLGAITPVGGLSFLLGWLRLIWAAARGYGEPACETR